MKIYAAKRGPINDLDRYIGKDAWILVDLYYEENRDEYIRPVERYFIRVLRSVGFLDSAYLCNEIDYREVDSETMQLLPFYRTDDYLKYIMDNRGVIAKAKVHVVQPVQIITTEHLLGHER